MSAFLGPVHVRMYDRILYQDEMAQALLVLAEERGWANGLGKQVDSKAPAASKEPLETLIDQSRIHGWLSEAVEGCERRFALIAGGILAGDPQRLDEMQGVMRKIGRQAGLPARLDAEGAFQGIHNMLLDGMPCDFPFNVTECGPSVASWQVLGCPHTPYWEAENYDAQAYYQLRDAWVEGALEGSGIAHERAGRSHALRKE